MPPGHGQPGGAGPVEVMPKFGGHSNLLLLPSRCGPRGERAGGNKTGSGARVVIGGKLTASPRSDRGEGCPLGVRACGEARTPGTRGGRRAPCQMREPRLAGEGREREASSAQQRNR